MSDIVEHNVPITIIPIDEYKGKKSSKTKDGKKVFIIGTNEDREPSPQPKSDKKTS